MKTIILIVIGVVISTTQVVGQQIFHPANSSSRNSYSGFVEGESVTDNLKELEEKFDKLEEGIEKEFKKQQEDFEKSIDGVSGKLKGKVDPGTSASTMKVFGRVHVDYWGFPKADPGINVLEANPDGPQDQISFRRLRFGVVGKLKGNMEYKIAMEFAGGNETQFRDAYLGFNDLPVLHTLLIGNQKRPYGLDALHSSRYTAFIERPFQNEAFNEDARRLGIQSYGVSEDQRWNWRYGVANMRNVQDEGLYRNDHLQVEVAGRIANTFWYDEASDGRGYGHWAISGSLANPDGLGGGDLNEARFRSRPEGRSDQRWLDTGRIVGATDYQLIGFENVWNFGSLQLGGEYQKAFLNRTGGSDLTFDGGYVYAAYWLTGEYTPWSRKSGTFGRQKPNEDFFRVRDCDGNVRRGIGAWQVAARWSEADFVDDDIFGGIGKAFTLGLNWHFTSNARMQFNYVTGSIENNGGNSGDYEILGTRIMVDF